MSEKPEESQDDFLKRMNSKKEIEKLSTINDYVLKAKMNNEIVNVNLKEFGNFSLFGVQLKDIVFFEDENGEISLKFLKLDAVNPKVEAGRWENDVADVVFSSITEDIVSRFSESINDPSFKSANYNFVNFGEIEKGILRTRSNFGLQNYYGEKEIITGTMSDVYFDDENVEIVLAKDKTSKSNRVLLDHDEYIEKIIDNPSNDKRLEHMIDFFKRANVDENEAKDFILKQAAFDLILSNSDRRENASNFVFSRDTEGYVTPINMDFGRCLCLGDATYLDVEERLEKQKEYWDDVVDMRNELSLKKGNGLFSGNVKTCIDFLVDNGFQSFDIDLDLLKISLDKTVEKVSKSKIEAKNIARLKSDMLIKRLKLHPELKRLLK